MKEQEQKMKLPKLDDLFTSQAQRDYEKAEKVEEIDINKIADFPNHPFKVQDDDKMDEMVKSVKQYGVILPVIVRPKDDGTYEMISGHRRKRACELAGIKQIRCIVKDLSDDEAVILMVDSNIQREEILPSEKAFAFKMKLEAMKKDDKILLKASNSMKFGEIYNMVKEKIKVTVIVGGMSTEHDVSLMSGKSILKNINKFTKDATAIINNSDIYEYNLKSDKDTDKKMIGFVIGEEYKTPSEVISKEGQAVELYSAIGILWKAVQELSARVEQLEKEARDE